MQKDRSAKVLAVIALVIAVLGLSLGFALFSQNLDIKPAAEVTPDKDKFRVVFSSEIESVVKAAINPTFTPNSGDYVPSGDAATITNPDEEDLSPTYTNPTISGINAKFTAPGQTVTYTFYAFNESDYDAYLRSIIFSGQKTCTPSSELINSAPGSEGLVTAACNGIKVKVTVGGGSDFADNATKDDFKGHSLPKGTGEEVKVEITYEEGSTEADGDFKVSLPDVTLNYQTVDKA